MNAERLWTFDAVCAGQRGPRTEVAVRAPDIVEYARLSRSEAQCYRTPQPLAMPTMILSVAPLAREAIAAANGYIAYEQSRTARRQTPFTKCEIRWRAPILAGDTIAADRSVLRKYQRRGSNFVTFRVMARNQHGRPVGDYDYTCIFDYAGPPKHGPAARAAQSGPASSRPLGTLRVTETQQTIDDRDAFALSGPREIASNIHTDPEFAKTGIFGGTVNSGPATMAYVCALLERYFPPRTFYDGGRLTLRATAPFHAGDTVEFEARASNAAGGRTVCAVTGRNQHGRLVCVADARLTADTPHTV